MNSIKLGNFEINHNSKPYIIAEIGVNHEGSIETAKLLIEQAKEGGAHAAKFQTYKADKIASKNSPAYWDLNKEPTKSQHALFKKYDTFKEKEFKLLSNHCRNVGIDFISTPFDTEAVDFLNPLVKYFKIASADITNHILLKKVAKTKKPIVMSTGASNEIEIEEALDFLEKCGNSNVALLHCVLNYPTINKNAHLNMINGLKNKFKDNIIGYSDHTLPDREMKVLTASVLMGAVIIEKHFTHDKSLKGNDHYHAMDIDDLKNFSKRINDLWEIRGDLMKKDFLETEEISRKNARRSMVLIKPMYKGDKIRENNIIAKRPEFGISVKNLEQIIGKKINKDLSRDHVLQWDDIVN